jgi:hypothetical protein
MGLRFIICDYGKVGRKAPFFDTNVLFVPLEAALQPNMGWHFSLLAKSHRKWHNKYYAKEKTFPR